MFTFLRSTTFCGVSLHNIHNCTYPEKGKIQDLLRKGIQRGIVKPLKNTVKLNTMQEEGLRDLFTSLPMEKIVITNKKNEQNKPSLNLNPNHICIVAGPDMECILSVAKWLTSLGTRKFAILIENRYETGQYSHQFNRLVKQHESMVLMSSLSRLDSPEKADHLLKEIYRMGTVSYIFCVSLVDHRVRMLEVTSEKFGPVQFVSLLCKGSSKGTIVSTKANDTSVSSVLPYLPYLLTEVNGQPRRYIMDSTESSNHIHDDSKCQLPLPRNLDQLISVGHCCGAPGFSEVVTLSPGLRHVRKDLLPVFLIPATTPASLQPLTRRLLHPAFCCSPPTSVQSIEQAAKQLMQGLIQVRDCGPFSLVGDSWNSLVAMQLGVLLEARGLQVEMFLLEGLPSTIKDAIRALGETPQDIEQDIELNLISTCLSLPKKVNPLEQLKTMPVATRPAMLRALESLLSQLTALTHLQPPRQLFQGHVTLITASQPTTAELNNLALFCKQTPRIVLTGTENHEQLVSSCKTASAINENTAFTWNM